MKKTILLIALLFSFAFYAQVEGELNAGVNAGIPIDQSKEVSSFAFSVEANYLFDGLFDNFKIGPSLSFIYYTLKELEGGGKSEPMSFLPIAVSTRFQNNDDAFYAGVDVGYGLGLSPKAINGGLYFKPMVGGHLSDTVKLNLFYSGVTSTRANAYSYLGLGLEFNISGLQSGYSY